MKTNKANSMLRRFFNRLGGGGIKSLDYKVTMSTGSGGGGVNPEDYKYSMSEVVDLSDAPNVGLKLYQASTKISTLIGEAEISVASMPVGYFREAAATGKKYIYIKRGTTEMVAKILSYNPETGELVTDKYRIDNLDSFYVYGLNKIYPYEKVQ